MASFYPAQFKNRTLRKCAHLCALAMGDVLIGFNQEYGSSLMFLCAELSTMQNKLTVEQKETEFPTWAHFLML